jgi:hypothetical protein
MLVKKKKNFLGSEQWRNKTSQALQTMIGKRQVNPADINCLYELYVKHGPKDALSLDYIHDPVFIGKNFQIFKLIFKMIIGIDTADLLVDALFRPRAASQRLPSERREQYMHLLAYASTAYDSVVENILIIFI